MTSELPKRFNVECDEYYRKAKINATRSPFSSPFPTFEFKKKEILKNIKDLYRGM